MSISGDVFTITEDGARVIGVLLLLLGGITAWLLRFILCRVARQEQSLEIIRSQLEDHRLTVARNYVTTINLDRAVARSIDQLSVAGKISLRTPREWAGRIERGV